MHRYPRRRKKECTIMETMQSNVPTIIGSWTWTGGLLPNVGFYVLMMMQFIRLKLRIFANLPLEYSPSTNDQVPLVVT